MENPLRTTRKAPGGRGAGSDPPNRFESLYIEPIPDDIAALFAAAARRHSLDRQLLPLSVASFQPPTDNRQLGLFPEA